MLSELSLGDQLEEVLRYLDPIDLICCVRPTGRGLAEAVSQPSLWIHRPNGTRAKLSLAEGRTRKAVESGDWCMTSFSPAPMPWLPKPLLLLRPSSLGTSMGAVNAPKSWPGGAPVSTPGIWAGPSAPGRCKPMFVVPTCCAFHGPCSWTHARIVGSSGHWAEIQSYVEEHPFGFTALLRWQRGSEDSDFLSEPLADWNLDQDAVIYSAGYGRVEWDHPPMVDTTQLLLLAQWLRLTAGEEASLWSALIQASRGRLLGKYMPQVRAKHGKDLASEAEVALRLVAELLPHRSMKRKFSGN